MGIAGSFAATTAPGADGPLRVAGGRAGRHGAVECVVDGVLPDSPSAVAAAYEHEGERALARLRGDFVVLLWDRSAQAGLIARDQLGGRAMYLHEAGGGLVFASEVRDLLAMLPRTPAPDRATLVQWLALRHPAGAATFYEGVRALLPGQLVRFGPQGVETTRFWTPSYREPVALSREEAVHAVRGDVDRALERTLAGSAKAGVLLSGGLDSTSLAVMGQGRSAEVQGYSAVFPDMPYVDESGYIDHVERAGTPVTRMAIRGGSMLRSALRFSRDWRLPLASQNLEFWLPLMGRAVADGADAMLDGEGGDLIFAARPELIGDRLRRGRVASAVLLARSLPGARDASTRAVLSVVAGTGVRAALPPALHDAVRRRGEVPPWMLRQDGGVLAATDGEWAWKGLDGPRWWARLAHALTDGLHATGIRDHQRRRAELAGLPTRSPFFDVDLVETMLAMPPELSFGPLSRPLQRELAAGALPDEVRLRPGKSYFDELFHRCLAVEDLPHVTRLLTAPDAQLRDWVDLETVRTQLFDRAPRDVGVRFWMRSVWRLVTAECWLRELAAPGSSDRLLGELALAPPDTAFVTSQAAVV